MEEQVPLDKEDGGVVPAIFNHEKDSYIFDTPLKH